MNEDLQDGEQPVQARDDTFYALLNIPRDASTELIKEKYRQLAVLLHPDKQQDEHRRATANDRFQRVKRAYEVLSNPQLRSVYDALGEEGLKYAGEVGQKYRTAEEIITEIERLARRSGVQKSLTTADNVIIGVDARPLTFDVPPGVRTLTYLERLSGIGASHFSVRHVHHSLVTPSTKLSLAARAASQSTRGSLIGTVRHQFSPRLTIESNIGFLYPHFASIRANYEVNPHTELSFFTRFTPSRSIFFPAYSLAVSQVLYPRTIGTVTFNSGWPPSLVGSFLDQTTSDTDVSPSSFEVDVKSEGWSLGTALSGDGSSGSMAVNGAYTYQVTETTDVSMGATIGIGSGLGVILTAIQRFGLQQAGVSQATLSVTAIVSAAGIEMRIRIARESQILLIPIKLSDDFNFTLALWTTLIPALCTTALEYFVLLPARAEQSRTAQAQARHQDVLTRRKLEAEQEVELLREQITKRVETEQRIDGLVILEGRYGSLRALKSVISAGGAEQSGVVDVTIACQALVHNSQLTIPGGRSKALLVGFYDPCYGEPKSLWIRYSFKGRVHMAEAGDLAPLKAPVRGHLIS